MSPHPGTKPTAQPTTSLILPCNPSQFQNTTMTTQSTTTPTALQIPEILSQIFLHLPPLDLITSTTRVSRLWHSLLETDPLLQRHLFFLPDPAWTTYPSFIPSPRKINPFFKTVFSLFFHPAFLGEMGVFYAARASQPHSNGNPQEGRLAHWSDEKRERMLRKGASWRRMGCWMGVHTRMGFMEREPSGGVVTVREQAYCFVKRDEGGGYGHVLTMGDFYDWIIEALGTVSKTLKTSGHNEDLNMMVWVIIWGQKLGGGSYEKGVEAFSQCRRVILRNGDKISEDEQDEMTKDGAANRAEREGRDAEHLHQERQGLATMMDCYVGLEWRFRMLYMPRPDAVESRDSRVDIRKFMSADGRDGFRTVNALVPGLGRYHSAWVGEPSIGHLLVG
ncbi:hypothetical protein QC762_301045 [Podospora pseudocomata]|uniref:F-box domain-containing protein n=1 Tax=Podospora pseudocomata TaxID=2093779 RepID=A0ABR0GHS0_9PEZI|nr:hypothetical protein QC762_301045 [Podospora pseudocomata]